MGEFESLLRSSGMQLEAGRLTVGRSQYELTADTEFEAAERPSGLGRSLAAMVVGMVGIPVSLYANTVTVDDYSWTVVLPVAMLLYGLLRLLTFDSRYELLLRTGARARTAYSSPDHQLIISLVAALRAELRRKRGERRELPVSG